MRPLRPCGVCRAPVPDGDCPTHPKRGGYRPGRPRHYDRAWRTLRDAALALAGYRCSYCSSPAGTGDHVIPLIKGGRSTPGNVVSACSSCNTSKGDRTLLEWIASGLAPEGARTLAAQRRGDGLPV